MLSDYLTLHDLLAIPIVWYGLNQWLNGFAYRITLGPTIFILGTAAGFLFALAAVSWQARSVSRTSPVDSFRIE